MKLFLFAILCIVVLSIDGGSKGEPIVPYDPPSLSGSSFFFDPFQSLDRWIVSTHPKFVGTWELEAPQAPAGIPADYGLVMKTPAAHHAIFTKFESPVVLESDPVVFQYEVRYQQAPISCAGSYVKLLAEVPSDTEFSNETPYTIMFGPDVCGDSKVHFIFKSRNPKTNEFEEHHLVDPPVVKNDGVTHLYTLIVNAKTNEYEIRVDDKKEASGSLLTDFQPPVNPPKEIPDPEAHKPEDWDEREFIPDPEAVKPEDWEEQEFIPDSTAEQPEDWDEEEDGEWAPPLVPNPLFKGEWAPPSVKNPDYNGKWEAPLIPNPDYFEVSNPLLGSKIAGLGLELWTMDADIMFNHMLLSSEPSVASEYAKATFHVKHKKEQSIKEAEEKKAAEEMKKAAQAQQGQSAIVRYLSQISTSLVELFKKNPVVSIITTFALTLSLFIILSRRKEKPVPVEGGVSETEPETETEKDKEEVAEVKPVEAEEEQVEEVMEEEVVTEEEEVEVVSKPVPRKRTTRGKRVRHAE